MENISINIARMYYPVKTLGPGDRMGIWLAGCPRSCEGCISPDFRYKASGRPVEAGRLMEMIKGYISESGKPDDSSVMRHGVTISGGEPFMQPEGLRALVSEIRKYTEDIIIFTGYLYEELLEKNNEDIDQILSMTGMLVDGPYVESLNDGTGMRGSSNQRFIILNHPQYYDHPENWERKIQGAVYGNKIITMGIPGKI